MHCCLFCCRLYQKLKCWSQILYPCLILVDNMIFHFTGMLTSDTSQYLPGVGRISNEESQDFLRLEVALGRESIVKTLVLLF